MALRFDDKVVVVTGSGGGIGKAYALAFASRGAKLVINDLGSSHSGQGASTKVADEVVDEIKKMGAEAVANYDSVEDGDKIIDTAVKAFGKVDILINNAGILRDKSFAKMEDQDWDLISAVHLRGIYKCTKAAWAHMQKNQFGRIINVSSAAGVYGNFGQVNYSTAKSGVLGFTKACAEEGARKNILSNCICPLAASRMTETVLPPDILDNMKPAGVVPLVLYLCHESSGANGEVVEAGAGWFAKIRVQRARGHYIPEPTPEAVQASWEKITDFTDATTPGRGASDSLMAMVEAQKQSKL